MAYQEQKQILDKNILSQEPEFFINGYNFKLGVDAKAESELNIVENKMYVAGKRWGYTDMQWTNFTGENITCTIYSRATDKYTGDEVQPDNGGISDFYKQDRTPHAVLKYWAQTFTKCYIQTNIQAFESGEYVIKSISQSSPHHNFIATELTFKQYEKGDSITQTFWTVGNIVDSSKYSAQVKNIQAMSSHKQQCSCTKDTPSDKCTAAENKEVKQIQHYLQQWGFFPSYSSSTGSVRVNGKFCYYTTEALKKFQEKRGIEITGNFDEKTKKEFIDKIRTT